MIVNVLIIVLACGFLRPVIVPVIAPIVWFLRRNTASSKIAYVGKALPAARNKP
jgi:hypothetical protein